MKLPEALLCSLEGVPGFDRDAFVKVHEEAAQVVSIRFNPLKAGKPSHSHLAEQVPWCSNGYYLSERPFFTFDPLLHAGVYYVQEASSMFVEQAMRQHTRLDEQLKVLDLCAAPGGKSTLIQSLINNESLLVSNEVIKARVQVLEENIIKWGASNVIITNNDSRDFTKLGNFFDVIVIDAPCSGSGLFRKDSEAISEWNSENVIHCSLRQKRILADVIPCLKPGGIIIYSTCSYSEEEDESILDWMLAEFPLSSLKISLQPEWKIVETCSEQRGAYGYRFYPDKLKGEGFFLSVLRYDGMDDASALTKKKNSRLETAGKTELATITPFLMPDNNLGIYKLGDRFFGLKAFLENDLAMIQNLLYIKKAGVVIGKLAGQDLIPDHQLALSDLLNNKVVAIELNRDQALQYLRKEEVSVNAETKGWVLVNFEGYHLGWVKVLQNRVNNYYPKDWRILKSGY